MSAPGHPESATSALNEHTNSRPKTLFQRLSSEIVHVLPSLRTSTLTDRTANNSSASLPSVLELSKTGVSVVESEVSSAPQSNFPKLEQPCPYDPKTYHSFTSIERRHRAFYSMREPQKKQSEPCLACRTGSNDAHISIDQGRAHLKEPSACNALQPTHLTDCRSSSRLGSRPGSRPGTPERAAKRVVSHRKSSRGSSSMVVSSAPKFESILAPLPGPPYELVTSLAEVIHTRDHDVGDKGETEETLVCPKLKSKRDLPYSEDLPLVHKTEIPLHARAAPASYLAERSITTKSLLNTSEELECSDTVDCSGTESISPIVLTRTIPLEPPVTIAPAKQVHVANEPVKIRGGNGRARGSSKEPGSKLKRWKRFCYGLPPEDFDPDSDAQPSRVCVEEPIRVVKTRETLRENLRGETDGVTPLPTQTSQGLQRTCSVRETWSEVADHPNRVSVTTTISGPPSPRPSSSSSLLSRLLLKYRYGQKPVESPATHSKRFSLSRNPSKSAPHLRGGAESPERTPPSLYWLAGGTGKKPVSIEGWKQSRPKQRMGGLLGMAVFGSKYGQEFKVQANVSGDLGNECSVSMKVTVEGTEIVHVSGGTDTPQPKSRSGSCLSKAAEAKPVEEAKPMEEAAAVADEAALIEPAPAREISEDVGEATLIESEDAIQRALSPPPADLADEVPLCSGALPLETSEEVEATAPIEPEESILRTLSPSPADLATPIEPALAGETSEDVEEMAPIESDEAIQRALSPPPTDPADDIPLCSSALPVETSDESAPIESEESIQRALWPPPGDPADGVPLCSGALPVENGVHTPHEDSPPLQHEHEDSKDNDTASEGQRE